MFATPSQAVNVQRQANQFLLPTQWQNEVDTMNVYPSVNAASNESIASLNAMITLGQSAPNQPSRANNDPLSQTLRVDRPMLDTFKAAAHQNPFPVPSRDETDFDEVLFTGGNTDFLMQGDEAMDMPARTNVAPAVETGLNTHVSPLFMGGDNMERSAVVPRKKDVVDGITIPESMDYRRFRVDERD